MSLRESTPEKEGILRVCKHLKHQVLLGAEEMEELCKALGSFEIYCVSQLVSPQQMQIPKELFLERYTEYVQTLKRGEIPDERPLRPYFSAIFTRSADILYAYRVGNEKFLIKGLQPVIQLQAHHFFCSKEDGKFRSMVMGPESVTWGLQFSYPQLYQDPKTEEFFKNSACINTELFKQLALWLRAHTLPTAFMRAAERVFVPIRVGKSCLSWVHGHPQLAERGLCISK